MTRINTTKKLGLRRFATVLAASGILVMSSGVALLVTATPANAEATKVTVCHATSSDSNPYTYISVDDDSVKLQGHLMHRQDPNKTWKDAGTFNGIAHTAGQAKPDLIGDFGGHTYDGDLTKADCDGTVVVDAPDEAVADVDFTDPTCGNSNEASYDTNGEFVTFEVTDGSAAPGATIEITATAVKDAEFAGGGTTKVFTHTFDDAVNLEGPPCVIVEVPGVATASVDFTDPSCDNSNVASYDPTGTNVTFEVTDGSAAAGQSIEVTATPTEGNAFADDTETKVFTHTFGAVVDCTVVTPPVVEPPVVTPPIATPIVATPTLVHAGLVSNVTPDLRNEQGMALLGAGMLLMMAAGGFGLRTSRR